MPGMMPTGDALNGAGVAFPPSMPAPPAGAAMLGKRRGSKHKGTIKGKTHKVRHSKKRG